MTSADHPAMTTTSFDLELPTGISTPPAALALALRVTGVVSATDVVVCALRGTSTQVRSVDIAVQTWSQLEARAQLVLSAESTHPQRPADSPSLVFLSTPTATPVDIESDPLDALHVSFACEPGSPRAQLRVRAPASAAFAGSLEEVFQQAVAQAKDPSQGPLRGSLLSHAQRERIATYNDTSRPFDSRTVIERVEQHARETPDRVAAADGKQTLSYAALAERAAKIAGRLHAQGVTRGSRVGIHLRRGVDLLACLLGVMKAGAAYVPLDPEFPSDRLAFMVEDAGVEILLTEHALVASAPSHPGINLAVDGEDLDSYEAWRGEGSSASSVAYVLYTSGSTGRPKGVEVPHRALSNFLASMAEVPGLHADDVLLAATSLSFDIAGLELYLPLMVGAQVVITPSGVASDGHALAKQLDVVRPTVFQATPSGYRLLLAAGWSGDPSLRILCGGEPLPSALAQSLLPCGAQLWNLYGPTETTIWSSAHRVTSAEAPVSIGSPIANTTFHILDPRGHAVPIGVCGELYIGGAGLACGYLGRPDLTTRAFVDIEGRRLYRTGDLARLHEDGTYEHLGRTDQQVKVRGFRIELGEVEAALQKVPTVTDAVAVVDLRCDGGKLLAYVASSDPNINMYEVRNLLGQTLPAYMIPGAYVFLEQLPLTPNGKVDRNALPAVEKVYIDESVDFAAPTNPQQATLVAVWQEVLDLDAVGIDDNYFALGGDSIRSVSIITRLREEGLSTTVGQLFDTPTIRTLAETVELTERVSSTSTEPFAWLSSEDRARLPEDVVDAFPLTALQVGMLHVMASHADAPLYLNTFGSRIEGPFDLEMLQGVLSDMVRRHPTLRSSIDTGAKGAQLQRIHNNATLPLTVEDLRGHAPVQQRQAVDAWMQQERLTAFDLERGPLVRFHIVRLDENAFSLLHTTHHALFDGWSTSAMVTEIVHRYDAALAGQPSDASEPLLEPLRARAALEHEASHCEDNRRFWEDAMADVAHASLPESWHVDSWTQHHTSVPLPPLLVQRLRGLAETTHTSMQAVILAGHVAVMAYLTGQDDVVTGVSVSGRPEVADADQSLGLFLNTAALRQSASAASWRALVERTHLTQRAVARHGLYPLSKARPGGSGTFVSLLNFMDFHVFDRARGLPRARLVDSEGGAIDAAQSFAMTEIPLEVDVCLEDVDGQASLQLLAHHMSPETVERIGGYYLRALHAMAMDADQAPQQAELLSPQEEQQLDGFATAPAHRAPLEHPPHHWLRHWAQETPDAVAVADEDGDLTYAALHDRVRAIAGSLHALGVGYGDRVGILHPRNTDLLACLLAVHTVGAAYVPLDPSHPTQRLAFTFDDAATDLVLTRSELLGAVPDRLRTVCLDEPLPGTAFDSGPALSPEDAAYLLYTSGSTGTPKGAVITHGAVANLLASMQHEPGMTSRDVGLAIASVAFDMATADLFVPLSVGAQVHLASSATVSDGFALSNLIERVQPTIMHATPSACRMLLAADWAGLSSLRLCCGGEALPPPLAKRLLGRVKALWNGYGPTECTVYTTFQRVTDTGGSTIPIGRPISGATLHVLDPHERRVPVGVAGELWIGGAGLARGYHARPELTEEKFISRPEQPRRYRTGDRVRILDDGAFDHRARIDHQVKIRGHRIELGEIEHALERCASIRAATVLIETETEGARLVGYVVGEDSSADALRTALRQTLPAYMIPAAFVILDALPMTPNGKVDRAALGAMRPHDETAEHSFSAPRSSVERTLASIWTEVLGVERVGIDDDFFALGGDSIHSVHILAKAKAQGVLLPTAALFDTPTIRELVEDLSL